MYSIWTGEVLVSDGRFFIIETDPERSDSFASILAPTAGAGQNINDVAGVASYVLKNIEFGSSGCASDSIAMDGMFFANQTPIVATWKKASVCCNRVFMVFGFDKKISKILRPSKGNARPTRKEVGHSGRGLEDVFMFFMRIKKVISVGMVGSDKGNFIGVSFGGFRWF